MLLGEPVVDGEVDAPVFHAFVVNAEVIHDAAGDGAGEVVTADIMRHL